jgi:hypothetical protein
MDGFYEVRQIYQNKKIDERAAKKNPEAGQAKSGSVQQQ